MQPNTQEPKQRKTLTFALVGNPNAGKSSIFNQLTGLRQKTGNFPGVTVDKKVGRIQINDTPLSIIDLPGTYSLYPNSQDERVVLNILTNPNDTNFPDAVIYIADLTCLERHLLLLTQMRDLGLPLVLGIGMIDLAKSKGIVFQKDILSKSLQIPIVCLNGRTGEGIELLKKEIGIIAENLQRRHTHHLSKPFYQPTPIEAKTVERLRMELPTISSNYQAILWAHHAEHLPFLTNNEKKFIQEVNQSEKFEDLRLQITETLTRFDKLQPIVQQAIQKTQDEKKYSRTDAIDRVLTHHFWGKLIFVTIMLFVFQSVFTWAEIPKGWIEEGFTMLNVFLTKNLPNSWLTSLLTEGVISGLSGVLTFLPQIAILFFLISILEEIGYMARAVYLFDRFMQRFGLNGRSIVSLVSGGACAIPAVMSTRTIANWKERLITIMVTPLISCSARIPVYALLVGLIVPNKRFWGIFDARGLSFAGLYALSVVSALLAAWVFKRIIKTNERAFLAIELPEYRMPVWKNILITVWTKSISFVAEAGKIILAISVALWFLASFGPSQAMQNAENQVNIVAKEQQLSADSLQTLLASKRLEASYAGHLGRVIEPAIRPLGFDWKIGIALISSFAAREVFVGTMATIYSIGNTDDDTTLRERMFAERRPDGSPLYTMATVISLLIFYVFAMQCMSTIAVVKRETRSWKWAIIQFLYMFVIAYLSSFIVFQLLK